MKENHLGYEIHKIEHLISRNIDNAIISSIGNDITLAQGLIIEFVGLNHHKDIYQKDIEAEFDIKRSAVSLVLKNMESNSLIKRVAVSSDLRLRNIVLTEKALLLCKDILNVIDKMESEISNGITDEESKIFFTVLNKIRKNIVLADFFYNISLVLN